MEWNPEPTSTTVPSLSIIYLVVSWQFFFVHELFLFQIGTGVSVTIFCLCIICRYFVLSYGDLFIITCIQHLHFTTLVLGWISKLCIHLVQFAFNKLFCCLLLIMISFHIHISFYFGQTFVVVKHSFILLYLSFEKYNSRKRIVLRQCTIDFIKYVCNKSILC